MTPRGVAVARVVLGALARPPVRDRPELVRWVDARPDLLTTGDPLAAVALPADGAGRAEPHAAGGRRHEARRRREDGASADRSGGSERPPVARRLASRGRAAGMPGPSEAVPVLAPAAGAGRGSGPPNRGQPVRAPTDGGTHLADARPQGIHGHAGEARPPSHPPAARPAAAQAGGLVGGPAMQHLAGLARALLGQPAGPHGHGQGPGRGPAAASAEPGVAPAPLALQNPSARSGTGPVGASRAGIKEPFSGQPAVDEPATTQGPTPTPAPWTRPAVGLLEALARPPGNVAVDGRLPQSSGDGTGPPDPRAGATRRGLGTSIERDPLAAEALADAVAGVLAEQARRHGVELR